MVQKLTILLLIFSLLSGCSSGRSDSSDKKEDGKPHQLLEAFITFVQ